MSTECVSVSERNGLLLCNTALYGSGRRYTYADTRILREESLDVQLATRQAIKYCYSPLLVSRRRNPASRSIICTRNNRHGTERSRELVCSFLSNYTPLGERSKRDCTEERSATYVPAADTAAEGGTIIVDFMCPTH